MAVGRRVIRIILLCRDADFCLESIFTKTALIGIFKEHLSAGADLNKKISTRFEGPLTIEFSGSKFDTACAVFSMHAETRKPS